MRCTTTAVVAALAILVSGLAGAVDEPGSEIPPAFAPFESMIGAWKGTGIPRANRIKGWVETHMWAWKFAQGVPVGMGLELKGDKTLAKGQLRYDGKAKVYVLEGTDPNGKPVVFKGVMDKSGKALVLDRVGETSEGKERLTIRPSANGVRYQMFLERQEPGAPQYKNAIEVGLTKEGESFAAGASVADLPKCIVTGGTATLNVVYDGKTYPLCCTGCRDEFNENPAKYVKKALLRAQAGGDKTPVKPASTPRGKDGGEFDGLVDEPAPKTEAPKKSASETESKAESLLNQAQALDKAGKSAPALIFYRRIVKEFEDSPAAKTAKERIKALGGK
jgi:YHS domain-containing protein